MKRTFKEKAVILAARTKRKYKIFTPLIIGVLWIVLFFYGIGETLVKNRKKCISLGVLCLFFIISSSFSFLDEEEDSEIYLVKNTTEDIEDSSVPEGENFEVSDVSSNITEEADVDYSGIYEDESKESLEGVETFTLESFYSEYVLNNSSDVDSSTDTKFDKDSWNLILVNKTHPLPDDYEIPLATISGSMQCDERVLDYLYEMLNAAKKDKVNLIVCSPYREYKLQVKIFNRNVNAYMEKGYSYLEAYKIVSQDVIVPGTSEHQLGLAFDMFTDDYKVLNAGFGETKGGKWLYDNAYKYGFILRYPEGKEDITGIEYEPWHYRFVGVEAATYIKENELTLEEFHEELE